MTSRRIAAGFFAIVAASPVTARANNSAWEDNSGTQGIFHDAVSWYRERSDPDAIRTRQQNLNNTASRVGQGLQTGAAVTQGVQAASEWRRLNEGQEFITYQQALNAGNAVSGAASAVAKTPGSSLVGATTQVAIAALPDISLSNVCRNMVLAGNYARMAECERRDIENKQLRRTRNDANHSDTSLDELGAAGGAFTFIASAVSAAGELSRLVRGNSGRVSGLVSTSHTGRAPTVDERRNVGIPDALRREQEERARRNRELQQQLREAERQRQAEAARALNRQSDCRPYWDGGSFECGQEQPRFRERRPEGDANTYYMSGGYAVGTDGIRAELQQYGGCDTVFDLRGQALVSFPPLRAFAGYCQQTQLSDEGRRAVWRGICQFPTRGPHELRTIGGGPTPQVRSVGMIADVVSDEEIKLYTETTMTDGTSAQQLVSYRRCR